MATVGRALVSRQGRSALQALTFPLIPALVLMLPFSQKQKSWRGLTHLVAQTKVATSSRRTFVGPYM